LSFIASRSTTTARASSPVGKPAPDLFLFAAERMNARPDESIVVEDSASGVAAGVAAGMTVLGFIGGSHCVAGDAEKRRAASAALVFDDMRRQPELALRGAQGGFPKSRAEISA
jgi:beta-phosphoglucomutase-like phosphatase (HAD superfamily)